MWTVPTKTTVRASKPGLIEKQIEDVMAGEIFSINAKARRFVLDSIYPKGQIMAHIISGESVTMPYAEYRDRFVAVWGEETPVATDDTRKFEEFDRVKHIKN